MTAFIQSFLIVGSQVAILFILIALGFFGAKKKMLNDEGIKSINNIMLYFVTPCVVIHAFQRDFDPLLLKNLIMCIIAAILSHAICFVLAMLLIKNKDEGKRKVYRFTSIFSNCGFMALPLLEALLGSEGVFYGAGYLAVFNILVWSFGQYSMAKGQGDFDVKKAILNPGVLASIIGVIFFFTSFKLPMLIGSPIAYLAALNTPVPMLIIGYTISKLDVESFIHIKEDLPTLLVRLVIAPLLLLAILYPFGYRGSVLVSIIVSASTPSAAISAMFAIKYNADDKLASKIVAISSLFSIITMTIIVAFTKFIAG
ncbi:MAG: AEC family transporter [Lachnospiraceae bacterium]|nr:AEC family transporter [Lachnospiraceae bacterium]